MRRTLFVCGLLVVLALGALALLGCSKEPGVIQGTVTQDPDGAPVPNAKIVVFGLNRLDKMQNVDIFEKGEILYQATTGENGTFSITVEPNEYIIEVRVSSRVSKAQQIEVKGGRVATVDLRVSAPSP